MSGTAQSVKATYIRIPNDFGPGATIGTLRTQNDFGTKKIAVTTSSQVEALNYEFSGQMVYLRFFGSSETDTVQIAATKRSSGTEIDTGAAAANNASTPSSTLRVGFPLVTGEAAVHFQLPEWDRNEICYLVHEGTGAGTLYLIKGS